MQARLSMSEIRQNNINAGFHTFDRPTMRFFKETMRDWKAGKVLPDGRQLVHQRGRVIQATKVYDPQTHRISDYTETL